MSETGQVEQHEHEWIDVCTWENHPPDGHVLKCYVCGAMTTIGAP